MEEQGSILVFTSTTKTFLKYNLQRLKSNEFIQFFSESSQSFLFLQTVYQEF